MSRYKKPIPDAVATVYGWAHPKTGELLVSVKNLPNPIKNYRRNCPPVLETPKPEKVVVQPIEIPEEKPAEIVKKSTRRGRKLANVA